MTSYTALRMPNCYPQLRHERGRSAGTLGCGGRDAGRLLCSDFDANFASFELDLDPTSRRSSLYITPSPWLMHGRVAYIEENLAL